MVMLRFLVLTAINGVRMQMVKDIKLGRTIWPA